MRPCLKRIQPMRIALFTCAGAFIVYSIHSLHTFFCELFGLTANDNSPPTADIPQVYVNQAYVSVFKCMCEIFHFHAASKAEKSNTSAKGCWESLKNYLN
jgi:hypothetical protein